MSRCFRQVDCNICGRGRNSAGVLLAALGVADTREVAGCVDGSWVWFSLGCSMGSKCC